jgi:hypothetical protein
MIDLISTFIEPLEKSGFSYMITGSVATIAYAQPRLTNDIDLILEISHKEVDLLCSAFPEDRFYLPPSDVIKVECARTQRGHLNIIHLESMLKADVYLCGNDPLHHWALARPVRIQLADLTVSFAPPEYVMLRKMEFFQEGGSEKHLRDIANIMETSDGIIDHSFLHAQINQRSLQASWERVKATKPNS